MVVVVVLVVVVAVTAVVEVVGDVSKKALLLPAPTGLMGQGRTHGSGTLEDQPRYRS